MNALALCAPLFQLGAVRITPRALVALENVGHGPADFLALHEVGEWGILRDEDRDANTEALVDEHIEPSDDLTERRDRLVSNYLLSSGALLWIITEADRSATTLLLADEY